MKKRCLSILAVTGIVSASFAFAADNNYLNGYYSTQRPQATLTAAKAMMMPPTDITITNASSNTIYAAVPGSPIYDTIYSGTNDHIRHNTYYGNTSLVFEDPSHNRFWSGDVCRLAVVTVYGNPGSYRVNVDSELCN